MPAFDLPLPDTLFENAEMQFNTFSASRNLKGDAFFVKEMEGTELRGIPVILSFTITAAAIKAAGLTLAMQNALLAKVQVDLKLGDGQGPNHILQGMPLTELRLRQLKDFETDIVGYGAGAGKGLSAPLAVGDNEVHCIAIIPLGHVESIDESNELMAVGIDQLGTIDLTLETKGDPLKAIDTDLVAKSLFVRFAADWRLAPPGKSGHRLSRWMDPPVSRKVVEGSKQYIEVPDCLMPIEAIDMANPNSTTAFGTLRVEVGGTRVIKGAGPTDIEANYEAKPDYNANEGKVALGATTLYRRWDMPLNKMPRGALTITQETTKTPFDARVTYWAVRSEAERLANLKLHTAQLAKRYGRLDVPVRYVGVPAVKTDIHVDDGFFMPLGWYACLPGDEEYDTLPSLEHKLGDSDVKLFIPPIIAAQKYGLWVTALSLNDKGTLLAVERSFGPSLPISTIGADGHASGAGFVMKAVRARFRSQLEAARFDTDGKENADVVKMLATLDSYR